MARETVCPVCNAYIPLESDDRVGDYVYCSYCGCQLRIKSDPKEKDQGVEVEEDWGDGE